MQDRDIFQGMRELNEALKRIPGVPLKWPTPREMRKYNQMFVDANWLNPYAPHALFFGAADCCRLGAAWFE